MSCAECKWRRAAADDTAVLVAISAVTTFAVAVADTTIVSVAVAATCIITAVYAVLYRAAYVFHRRTHGGA